MTTHAGTPFVMYPRDHDSFAAAAEEDITRQLCDLGDIHADWRQNGREVEMTEADIAVCRQRVCMHLNHLNAFGPRGVRKTTDGHFYRHQHKRKQRLEHPDYVPHKVDRMCMKHDIQEQLRQYGLQYVKSPHSTITTPDDCSTDEDQQEEPVTEKLTWGILDFQNYIKERDYYDLMGRADRRNQLLPDNPPASGLRLTGILDRKLMYLSRVLSDLGDYYNSNTHRGCAELLKPTDDIIHRLNQTEPISPTDSMFDTPTRLDLSAFTSTPGPNGVSENPGPRLPGPRLNLANSAIDRSGRVSPDQQGGTPYTGAGESISVSSIEFSSDSDYEGFSSRVSDSPVTTGSKHRSRAIFNRKSLSPSKRPSVESSSRENDAYNSIHRRN